ncbi:MAG: nucleotidyltransferase domain-containing protein [Firmicutes bacterium]|jgi:predicted nucleotidyltransferase|nr:nucleotidyltransferase domain-containing protein [Bacillota bacterium]
MDAAEDRVRKRKAQLESELNRFVGLLKEHLDPHKIILFGSLAEGDIREWSDIDLVIVYETSLPFTRRMRDVLALLKPRVGVDLFPYTPDEFERMSREGSFIHDEVLKKGRLLHERGETVAPVRL